ncbi:MAG: SurA N-terminal domain-containing protein [Proteobacteria bacterium]|nr:SurA N-terminal domain-containing protein [Pseudomonadota bacterium]
MIQSFQKFSQSRVAKIFLAVVALSFMAFFGGGSWFRPHDPNAIVAEVGNLSISRYEFAEKVQQQIQRLMAQSDESLTREQIIQEGLPQMILSQMIQEILFNLESESLGLTVSDEAVRREVQSMKAFQNESGVFERTRFDQILRANGLSEDTFIAEIRSELIRHQLADAIVVGAFLPDEMVNRLFEAQYQFRQASLLFISPKEMPAPKTPGQDVLEAFYNAHQKEFETPELRTITAFIIDPTLIGKEIQVNSDEIKSMYEAKSDIYGQMKFEKATPLIIAEIQKEKGLEKAFQLTQDLDDQIAGGATLEELAPTVQGGKLIKLEKVDNQGLELMKTPAAQLPEDKELTQDILKTAFSLEEASDSPFSQAKNGAYYMVRVDKVNPASFQPFAEIKDRVEKAWAEQEQLKAAEVKANEYVTSFNNGDRKVSLMTLLPNLSLSEPSPDVPTEIKQLVFSLRPEHAGMILTSKGFAIVVLNRIIPPVQKVKEEKIASFKEKLLEQYQNDLLNGYLNALRVRYPVKVNNEAIKALFSM